MSFSTLVNLLPIRLRDSWANRLVCRIAALEAETASVNALLHGLSGDWEYLDGYRAHLVRRTEELFIARERAKARLAVVDPNCGQS